MYSENRVPPKQGKCCNYRKIGTKTNIFWCQAPNTKVPLTVLEDKIQQAMDG